MGMMVLMTGSRGALSRLPLSPAPDHRLKHAVGPDSPAGRFKPTNANPSRRMLLSDRCDLLLCEEFEVPPVPSAIFIADVSLRQFSVRIAGTTTNVWITSFRILHTGATQFGPRSVPCPESVTHAGHQLHATTCRCCELPIPCVIRITVAKDIEHRCIL